MITQLTDSDGDGIYMWSTNAIPAGNWEVKVTMNYRWDENYGMNGEYRGSNIPFSVSTAGQPVTFTYDSNTHLLDILIDG